MSTPTPPEPLDLKTPTRSPVSSLVRAMVDQLACDGVRTVFGLMGDDTASLVAALGDSGIEFLSARHENTAVAMADGYAWATGDLGVAVISRGPGLTNAMTAAANAVRGRRRMLLITGDAPLSPGPGPDLKLIDHVALAAAAGVEFHTGSTPETALAALRAAVTFARNGAPSLLSVPGDVLYAADSPPMEVSSPSPPPAAARPRRPSASEVAEVVELLTAAERPLILAGRGAVEAGAREKLEELAERTGALLGTTLRGKAFFRGARLDFGIVGGFTSESLRPVLDEVDLLLVFGASLTSYTTGQHRLFAGIPVVQFDSSSESLNAYFRVTRGVVADAALAVEALLESPELEASANDRPAKRHPFHRPETLERLARSREREVFDDNGSDKIDPRELAATLHDVLPEDRTIVTDGGHFIGFPAMHMQVLEPDRFRFTSDFSAVGMGLGTALGAAVARPGSQTVLFVGDGGLAMTLGDLETVARCEIPLIIVVMNDQAFGAERHYLELLGFPGEPAIFPDIDFARVAAGLGIESSSVRTLEDLPDLSALRTAPLLLDCKIDGEHRSRWLEELV